MVSIDNPIVMLAFLSAGLGQFVFSVTGCTTPTEKVGVVFTTSDRPICLLHLWQSISRRKR